MNRPQQLIKHIVQVIFITPKGELTITETDCADPQASRELGRKIASWLARGVEYSVQSATIELVRR